jgi:hypothetical protein
MGRVLIEIMLLILISSIAFVLGAIVGSGKRRSEEKDALLKEELESGQIVLENHLSPLS